LQALWALADLKLHSLPFVEAAVTLRLNGCVMHENILTGLALDEAKPLLALNHFTIPCSFTNFLFS
jgi:hypothetical protein